MNNFRLFVRTYPVADASKLALRQVVRLVQWPCASNKHNHAYITTRSRDLCCFMLVGHSTCNAVASRRRHENSCASASSARHVSGPHTASQTKASARSRAADACPWHAESHSCLNVLAAGENLLPAGLHRAC